MVLQNPLGRDEEVTRYKHLPSTTSSTTGRRMSSRRASLSDLLPVWLLSSQTCIRALLIGVCLSIIHTAGILLAVYLLLTRLIDPGVAESPYLKVCTSAISCPLYRLATDTTGTAIQLVTSIAGLVLNVTMVLGLIHSIASAVFIWLVAYIFTICGCGVLFGFVLSSLLRRRAQMGDVSTATLIFWPILPVLLGGVYVVLWIFVHMAWKKIRRRKRNTVFACIE